MRPILAALIVIGFVFVPTARADVPPPPDSPDAHCSLAEQCDKGVLCPYAFHPGAPPAPGEARVGDACRSSATTQGLERRCRSGGNYSGQELFCPKGATGTWKPPGPAASRCSAAAGDDGIGGMPAVAVAGGLMLIARRKRARARRRSPRAG
jgi:hypothetical protein